MMVRWQSPSIGAAMVLRLVWASQSRRLHLMWKKTLSTPLLGRAMLSQGSSRAGPYGSFKSTDISLNPPCFLKTPRISATYFYDFDKTNHFVFFFVILEINVCQFIFQNTFSSGMWNSVCFMQNTYMHNAHATNKWYIHRWYVTCTRAS